jgi:acyl dehydratase
MEIEHLIELTRQNINMEIGLSNWFKITQELISNYGECINDNQWIHVDVEKAKYSQYKSTIAHGFLIVSLLPYLTKDVKLPINKLNAKQKLNYGLDKVRFISPVLCNSYIKCSTRLMDVTNQGNNNVLVKVKNIIYAKNDDSTNKEKPVCTIESLILFCF